MPDPITPSDVARDVIAAHPDATKTEWGSLLDARIDGLGVAHLKQWRETRLHSNLGAFVAGVKSGDDLAEAPKVTSNGKAMTPTISVDGQLRLWYEVTPAQWVAAVEREQQTVNGRLRSNLARRRVVALVQSRPDLMELPTVADVFSALGVDRQDMKLGEAVGE